MKKPGKNSLTHKILLHLIDKSKDLLDLSLMIMFDPKELVKSIGLYTSYSEYPSSYYKNLSNLKKSPYFSVKNNKFYLSSKGRIEIIKIIIREKSRTKKWDGKWWAIIFDIPEAIRRERNFLRKELKWLGFKELQHSIWFIPYNIEKELLVLLKLWHKDFKGDIRFLKIDRITEDKDLKKLFNL